MARTDFVSVHQSKTENSLSDVRSELHVPLHQSPSHFSVLMLLLCSRNFLTLSYVAFLSYGARLALLSTTTGSNGKLLASFTVDMNLTANKHIPLIDVLSDHVGHVFSCSEQLHLE